MFTPSRPRTARVLLASDQVQVRRGDELQPRGEREGSVRLRGIVSAHLPVMRYVRTGAGPLGGWQSGWRVVTFRAWTTTNSTLVSMSRSCHHHAASSVSSAVSA